MQLLKLQIEEAKSEINLKENDFDEVQVRTGKMNRRLVQRRTKLCRRLRSVESIHVNNVVELIEIVNLKDEDHLDAEVVKVKVSDGVNNSICCEIEQEATANKIKIVD